MRLLSLALFMFACVTSTYAGFKSHDEVVKWFTFYYENPEPARLVEAIEYMSQSEFLDRKNAGPPIFGFLAGVFSSNPGHVEAWVKQLGSIKESHLGVVVQGLWYANLPQSRSQVYALLNTHPELKGQFAYLYKDKPIPIEKISLDQGPWVLDALWGKFMATGNKEPVVRIMSTLPWVDLRNDINRFLVGSAARWSLGSNAVQHKRILQICEQELAAQPQAVADKLQDIITQAQDGQI